MTSKQTLKLCNLVYLCLKLNTAVDMEFNGLFRLYRKKQHLKIQDNSNVTKGKM